MARQEHTDVMLAPVTDALLAFAAPSLRTRVWRSYVGVRWPKSRGWRCRWLRSRSTCRRGWAPPRFEKLDIDLNIAAGRGLEEAVVQSTQIGAVNSWLRNLPAEVASTAVPSLREALASYANKASVRLPGAAAS